jgi:hypothetical protein
LTIINLVLREQQEVSQWQEVATEALAGISSECSLQGPWFLPMKSEAIGGE